MGGGMSKISELPPEKKADCVKYLRIEFDKLVEDNLPDNEIQAIMEKVYKKWLDEHVHDLHQGWEEHKTQAPHHDSTSKISKKKEEELIVRLQVKSHRRSFSAMEDDHHPHSSGDSPPPKKSTRRKSFAQVPPPLPAITESHSTVVITDAPHGVDSWDSVTQQPFCSICLMAFKTLSALDRHERFSDLHQKVVQKRIDDYEKTLITTKDVEQIEVEQIEGIHYKLLYSGRKLFWRIQDSVDLSIYFHFESNCVEIIAFDINSAAEFNRVYLLYDVLVKITNVLFERKEFDEKEVALIAAQTPLEKEESLRLSLTTFVLSRLTTEYEGKGLYDADNRVTFRSIPSDPEGLHPLLTDLPKQLHPVRVSARRRSSTEDIAKAFRGFEVDANEAKNEVDKAEFFSGQGALLLDSVTEEHK